jgi:hypothetical protein
MNTSVPTQRDDSAAVRPVRAGAEPRLGPLGRRLYHPAMLLLLAEVLQASAHSDFSVGQMLWALGASALRAAWQRMRRHPAVYDTLPTPCGCKGGS